MRRADTLEVGLQCFEGGKLSERGRSVIHQWDLLGWYRETKVWLGDLEVGIVT
jgi:hypothetical protein